MSGLLNLGSTLAEARARLAARSFSSPAPAGSTAASSRRGVSFASPASSPSLLASGVGGGVPPGESLFYRTGGGVGGDLSVFVLTPELHSQLCLGVVNGGVKFCTLGNDVCSYAAHARKVDVAPNHLYISGGRNTAYSQHRVYAASLGEDRLQGLLREQHTRDEWVRLFHAVNEAGAVSQGETAAVTSVITPKKRKARYMEEQEQSVSLTAGVASLALRFPDMEGAVLEESKLEAVMLQWDNMVATVNELAVMVRNFKELVGSDVDELEAKVQAVDSRIGRPVRGDSSALGEDCATTWDALTYLNFLLQDLFKGENTNSHRLSEVISQVQQIDTEAKNRAMTSERALGDLKLNLEQVVELVQVLGQEQAAIVAAPGGISQNQDLANEISALRARVDAIETAPPVDVFGGGSTATTEINSIKVQMRLLEARMPADPMTFGGRTFHSRMGVMLFVENEMPSNSYSLFHDAVTLLESLSDSYVERRDVLTEWHQAVKVGLNEAESRTVASFRLVLPTVFGQVKEGTSSKSKHFLPAVKTYDSWNPHDNVSGVKRFIEKGLDDLRLQIRQDISSGFEGRMEAKILAQEMHENSQIFIAEMCSWMDSFYQELRSTSDATAEEAWELTSACIKKVFEELRRPRAGASNATADPNPVSKCATYLWALMGSHRVMKEFVESRFRNHPAIAPVINLHVFKTRVTKVAFDGLRESIRALNTRCNFMDKLHDRVAKLEAKK